MNECNIFIAPRYFEGIGWSFIEAMTKGMAVVAFNQPTMNEYIKNGVNGYLIDEKKTETIRFKDFFEIGQRARINCIVGYKKWQNQSKNIAGFIKSVNISQNKQFPEEHLIFKVKYFFDSLISDWKFKKYLTK